MPSIIREKELRQAVVKIQDAATYNHACSLLQDPTLDVNACGSESGKSALNFAIEKLFIPLVNKEQVSQELVQLRLRIIAKLLVFNARISALDHPYTKKLLEAVQVKVKSIRNQIIAKVSTLKEKKEFTLENFFSALDDQGKLFIAAFAQYDTLFNMAKKLTALEEQHKKSLQSKDLLATEHKAIIIFENHADDGAFKLISKLEPKIVRAGYNTICLELPFESKDYMDRFKENIRKSKLLSFLSENKFARLKFIDLRRNYDEIDPISLMIDTFANNLFDPDISLPLRDKGMFFLICEAALESNGKIIVIVGMAHNNILDLFDKVKMPYTVVTPFVDASNVFLIEGDGGNFSCPLPAEHNFALLFSRFSALPLCLADDTSEKNAKAEEAIERFSRLCLSI